MTRMIRFKIDATALHAAAVRVTDPVPFLLEKLKNVTQTKSGWQAKCPAHQDDRASLSVTKGDDDRALVHCHAGCSALEICHALNIEMRDLMPPASAVNGKKKAAAKPVALYDYMDENGNVLFQVVRFEPKDFRQRKPDGHGEWKWSVKGVRVVPYRLDRITANPGRPVVVVEGEKDVHSLESIGCIATCNAGGAMKWTADHAEHLANRNVIIIPDNDKAGREHAESVAQSLWGVAASIKIIDLPGLSAKGDVSDWIAAGGTHDQLKQIADVTDEWRFGGAAAKDSTRRIEVIHARDFATHDYRPNWLVKRVLVAGQPAVCGGRSKAMKTSNLVDLAVSLGTGTPFLGHFPTERTTVAILSGESGAFTIQETAKRVAQARGVSLADADVYFGFTLPYITRLADVDATARMIEDVRAKVLIVDPAYLCLLGGDAGGRQASNVFDMGPLLLRLSDIGNRTGSTIILCHHCKKTTDMSREKFDPPDLEELSMAGFHEWARQWLLIGRRERFEPGTGLHRLWLNVGGSVGFSGTWSVDIDEGVIGEDFSGRKWDVSVGSLTDAAEEKKREQDRKADEKRRAIDWEREVNVTKVLRQHKDGLTRRQLREATGMSGSNVASTVLSILQKGGAVEVDGMAGNRPCKIIVLTDKNYQPELQTASSEPSNYEHAFDAYAPQTPDF